MSKAIKLTLQGFRGNSARADIDLAKYTFICGKNAANKSSIVSGFKTAYFGNVPECCLNTMSQDAVAMLEFDNGTSIKTVYNEKKTTHYLNSKSTTKKDLAAARENLLNMDPEVAEIFFRDGQFALDLKPEEFSKLVGGVLPQVPTDNLIAKCGMSAGAQNLFRKVYNQPSIDFDSIAAIHKTLSEMFRALNKEINAAENTIRVLCTTTSGKPLELLKKRRDELLDEMKTAKSATDALQEYEKLRKLYQDHMKEIMDLQNQLDQKPENIDPKLVEEAIERLGRINKKINEDSELIAVLTSNIETNEKIIKELSSSVCPISRQLVCTTDKTGVRSELEKNISDSQKALEGRRQSLASTESIKQATEKQIVELREKERAQQDYLRMEERLNLLRANMPQMPVAPTVSSDGYKDIEEIRKALDEVDSEIANAGNAEKSKQLTEAVNEKKKEREVVEELRTTLAPKGKAYNVILDAMCGKLNDLMNEIATDLGIDKIYEFRIDSGMTMYGKKATDPQMIPVRYMSTGERFMTHLVLMTLINEVNNVNCLVLDNIDSLDAENLEKVLKLISSPKYENRFENIIMAGVSHDDTMEVLRRFESTRADVKVMIIN